MSAEALVERFGANLKRCRRRAELSQADLGELALLSRQAISLIELGQRKPYIETFVGLAAALDIEAGVLLDGIGWVVAQQGAAGNFRVDPLTRQFFFSTQRPRTSSPPVSKVPGALVGERSAAHRCGELGLRGQSDRRSPAALPKT